jgi:SAM-dependent methyltransferase
MKNWFQEVELKWANFTDLLTPDWFDVTMSLRGLEIIYNKRPDSLHHFRRVEFPWAFNELKPYRKEAEEEVVLEAGAGRTMFQVLLSGCVKEVVSLDNGPSETAWVQENLVDKGITNLRPVTGDLTCLEFPSNHFDKVFCISTMEHVPREKFQDAIDEMVRVTKPGGQLAITMDVVLGKCEPPICGSQVHLADLNLLAYRYHFQIPLYPVHMIVQQNDTCLLTVGLLHIKKGWTVGDWE